MVIIQCIAFTKDGVNQQDSVVISYWIIVENLISMFLLQTYQILDMVRLRVVLMILESSQKKKKRLKDYLLREVEVVLGLLLKERLENL